MLRSILILAAHTRDITEVETHNTTNHTKYPVRPTSLSRSSWRPRLSSNCISVCPRGHGCDVGRRWKVRVAALDALRAPQLMPAHILSPVEEGGVDQVRRVRERAHALPICVRRAVQRTARPKLVVELVQECGCDCAALLVDVARHSVVEECPAAEFAHDDAREAGHEVAHAACARVLARDGVRRPPCVLVCMWGPTRAPYGATLWGRVSYNIP